jgi:pyridinium-3,5-biscarboxylic acid mononucleotide synthase
VAMTDTTVRQLLEAVQAGRVPVEDALGRLGEMPFEDLGFAKVDHHRRLRCGFPEVVFCQGKTLEQIESILERIAAHDTGALATRVAPEQGELLLQKFAAGEYNPLARTFRIPSAEPVVACTQPVLVITAGTSDLPVASEAQVTAEAMGCPATVLADVGVAGIHRLLSYRDQLTRAAAIVVAAGMEGALASVVGGLVDCPVIAVPTSVGYGASFGGVAALLAMLNICAANVTVVNIDNGFGAGYVASLIARRSGAGTPESRGDL